MSLFREPQKVPVEAISALEGLKPLRDPVIQFLWDRAIGAQLDVYYAAVPFALIKRLDTEYDPRAHPIGRLAVDDVKEKWEQGQFRKMWVYEHGDYYVMSDDYIVWAAAQEGQPDYVPCWVLGKPTLPGVEEVQGPINPSEIPRLLGFADACLVAPKEDVSPARQLDEPSSTFARFPEGPEVNGVDFVEESEVRNESVDESRPGDDAPQLTDPASHYLDEGLKCAEKKELTPAIEEFSQAIRCDPQEVAAYVLRADRSLELSKLDDAIESASAALAIDPGCADAYFIRRKANFLSRELDLAIADWTKAIELEPKEPRYRYARALAFEVQGKDDVAIKDYSAAIDVDPTFSDAYYCRGRIFHQVQQFARAVADYDEALRLEPKHEKCKNMLQQALRELTK